MNVIAEPSAREMFTSRELAAAFEDFIEHRPQYLDAETGLRAAAYSFGEHTLIDCQESETDVVVLIHPTSGIESLKGSDQPPEDFPYPLPTDTRLRSP